MKPVVRWAWRMFRKEWRQQLLVLALLIVAVAAAVTGSTLAVGSTSESRGQFGNAKSIVHVEGDNAGQAQASIAEARRRYGDIEIIGHTPVPIPGSADVLDLRAQDPAAPLGKPLVALRDGRYPRAANEVALTKSVARLLDVRVGQSLMLAGEKLLVVGEVENPESLGDDFALRPASLASGSSRFELLTSFSVADGSMTTSAVVDGQNSGARLVVQGKPGNETAVAATVLIMTVLGMALVALIAAAGFVVVAQRRQRQLGLLGALGATERHLKTVMIANGFIVGVIAAVVGGVLGVVGWIGAAPALETAIGHRVDRFDLPWQLTIVNLLLAILGSIAAAWWPARQMARLPIMSALSRRPMRPAPVRRSLAVAVALTITGSLLIRQSNGDERVVPWMLMGGLLLVIIGIVTSAPGAVRSLSKLAPRLPFAGRLALRDLVRYQARAAASLAAITLGLGIATTIVILASANVPAANEGNLSATEILVTPPRSPGGPFPGYAAADTPGVDAKAAAIAAAIDGATLLPLDVVVNATALANPASILEPIAAVEPMKNGFRGLGTAYVATPELLAALNIDPSTVDAATELITWNGRVGEVTLLDVTDRKLDHERSVVQRMATSPFWDGPRSLITETAIRKHGWATQRAAWIVQSPHAITTGDIVAARKAAALGGLAIESRYGNDDLNTLRTGATVVGGLLALAIVAMTIGLLRGESTRDLRTLTATGAPPVTRRAITASTAGALALLGAIVSIVGSYAAILGDYSDKLDELASPPVANLLIIAVGLPLVAAAGGWLLGGREPATFSRQALD